MSLWRRLWRTVGGGGDGAPAAAAPPAPAAPSPAPPAREAADADEAFLRALLDQLAAPAPGDEVILRLDGDAVPAALDRLAAAGRARTAIELLHRLVALPPALHRGPGRHPLLRARLGELLVERRDHAGAIAALTPIADDPGHGPRARLLLAEAAEHTGDLDGARRHYEVLLAHDIDHPRARSRLARLRGDEEGAAAAAAAPTMAGLEADRTAVGDRYRLRAELGRGASSTVYLAHDLSCDRNVALKLLHAQASARATAEARMRSWTEARMAAALRHPGVVAIYDLDEQRGLIAMELCGGGTLRERLVRGRLPVAEALAHARSLLATLAAVHGAGVVHRDLKPGNLLLRSPAPALPGDAPPEALVLGDFGLALLEAAIGGARPAGTLDYLAPEARRGEASVAADLYAAGVVLHEMVLGERPRDRGAALRGEALAPAPLPAAVAGALGPTSAAAVHDLLTRLLSADPAARGDATAAAAALAAV